MTQSRLLIYASGTATSGGSGAEQLVLNAQSGRLKADIVGIVSNYENGGVRERADRLGVPFFHYAKPISPCGYQYFARETGADFFALSGWLKLVEGLDPKTNFNSRTVFNIHPGLLPDFGGPGMYGHHVHEAVMAAYGRGEVTHSGLSMHFVTAEYDRGPTFFECRVPISADDTPDSLGKRVNRFEHEFQSTITDMIVNRRITWDGVNPDSLTTPTGHCLKYDA